jgi:hypothetical protein
MRRFAELVAGVTCGYERWTYMFVVGQNVPVDVVLVLNGRPLLFISRE